MQRYQTIDYILVADVLFDPEQKRIKTVRTAYLEILAKGIGQTLRAWEGTENYVSELDTPGRYDVTEGEVIITEELREVVEKNEQTPQSTLVQSLLLEDQFCVTQEGVKELEQVDKKLLVEGPALPWLGLVLGSQHLVEELPLRDEFQPGVSKARQVTWLEVVVHRAEIEFT